MDGWTNEQLDAINARGTGVIVSAAAGSGKTSVLVERLVRVLSDNEERLPADRLVVVTYTNDAAEQMRRRLRTALSEKISREPGNSWLCRQQALLQTAKISTIHSFCFDLIRENIRFLDVSAGFRIIADAEESLLRKKAAENVFERLYAEQPEETGKLAMFFSGRDRGDKELEETLLRLYEFLMSIPFYRDWLDKVEERYRNGFDPDSDPFAELYLRYIKKTYRGFLWRAKDLERLFEELYGRKSPVLEEETEYIRRMIKSLEDTGKGWDELVTPPAPPKTRIDFPKGLSKEEKAPVEKARRGYKSARDKFVKGLFMTKDIEDDYKAHAEVLRGLFSALRLFDRELAALKTEKNVLGFSDAEQLAIRLLAERDGDGNIVRTPLAEELSEYYGMIMIDEFQDANDNQELIFRMLSRDGSNLFAVGDVKQSIYSFRQANPKVFTKALAEAEPYTGKNFSGKKASVLLNKNFRSSGAVIDFVNYLSGLLMSEENGGVEYGRSEELVQGLEYPEKDRTTEVLIVPSEDKPDDDGGEDDGIVCEEARAAAVKIKSMLLTETVLDGGAERPCRPGDFCILVRSNEQAEEYVKELNESGLAAYAEEPKGYLDSREISVLTGLLAAIDNPMRNIPLTAALMSPMFMLTAEDMAALSLRRGRDGKYFLTIKRVLAGETDIDPASELYRKLEKFMRIYDKLRYCAASQSLERFIRTIYDSTDFLSAMQIREDGGRKRANLRLLLEMAESYDGGLSGFVRYLDNIKKNGSDFRKASAIPQSDSVVTVNTMHRSKGLEYPFVFICGTSKNFNTIDMKKRMQLDPEYGAGLKIQDRDKLRLYDSLPHTAIRFAAGENIRSEEMRLLYVALTRARERLFITVPDNEKVRERIASLRRRVTAEGRIRPAACDAKSMLDWITLAMLTHPDGEWFRDGEDIPPAENAPAVRVLRAELAAGSAGAGRCTPKAYPDPEKVRRLREKFDFVYDCGLADKPAKITVTEIAKSEESDRLYLRRPDFSEAGGLTAAEKGTAMHTFMQYADFAAAEKDPAAEAERLVEYGLLSPEEGASLNIEQAGEFFRSELYGRIKRSGSVSRERKFLIRKSDAALDDSRLSEYNDNSMLQGIADCMFEEGDGIVLIDYKTDRGVTEKVLADRYDLQLRLYAAALAKILGKPVTEAYLYSFTLNKAIRVL